MPIQCFTPTASHSFAKKVTMWLPRMKGAHACSVPERKCVKRSSYPSGLPSRTACTDFQPSASKRVGRRTKCTLPEDSVTHIT